MMTARVTPEEFFDTIVPQHLESLEVAQDTQRTYVFRLFGEKPAEWSIDLGRRTVRRGALAKPDLYLEMDRDDFTALLAGRFDPRSAVQDGRVRFDGKISLLSDLGRVLQPQAA